MISAFGVDHGEVVAKQNLLAVVGNGAGKARVAGGRHLQVVGNRMTHDALGRADRLVDDGNPHTVKRMKRLLGTSKRGVKLAARGVKHQTGGENWQSHPTRTGAMVVAVPTAAATTYGGVKYTKKKVSKSYIPGKGWVKASEAGVAALKDVKLTRRGRYGSIRRRSLTDHQYMMGRNEQDAEAQQHTIQAKMQSYKPVPGAKWGFGKTPSDLGAYTVRRGSKSHGTSTVVLSRWNTKTPKQADSNFRHEMAHAKPKRSEYRLHQQIGTDPVKRMREEGRADMAGGTYWRNAPNKETDSGYVGGARMHTKHHPTTAALMSGMKKDEAAAYRDVQDRIATARSRKSA